MSSRKHILLLFILNIFCVTILQANIDKHPIFSAEVPKVVLRNISFEIKLTSLSFISADSTTISYAVKDINSNDILKSGTKKLISNEKSPLTLTELKVDYSGHRELEIQINGYSEFIQINVLPPILSILPAFIAILFALITHQVIIALFAGIWLGVFFIYDYNPILGFLHTLDQYLVNAIADPDRISILIFSLVLGGMVGVITRTGGTQGLVEKLSVHANSARRGQLMTWVMGVLIFFDDYANTLIVGNTMRPLADKLKISREKLAYLVDSTAAPVANIAVISTWIGYEISLISQSYETLGINQNAYVTFILSIPFNYYPIYALFFGFLIAYLGRDFGAMYKAETRSRRTGQLIKEGAIPLADLTESGSMGISKDQCKWYNAFIPVCVVILVVFIGLIFSGYQTLVAENISLEKEVFIKKISLIIGNANSFAVLMWASFIGSITAIVLALGQKILSLQEAMEAWIRGIRSMVMAAIILTAAWTIGTICQELFTAEYVIMLTQNFLSPHWLPLITFLTAGLISFATGTSWGTMAILMPIAIPLASKFPNTFLNIEAVTSSSLMLSTIAAVLAGATFGDHCSPISDTTIMSSMASGSDHIDHVRTQLPYALIIGLIACIFGYIPIGFAFHNWINFTAGFGIIFIIIRFVGKKTG